MQIISGTKDFQLGSPAAVAIGKFDGVHLGHQKLLHELIRRKEQGLSAAILTFHPGPEIFFGIGDGKVLTTEEEKRRVFRELGIDVLIEYPFDRDTADTPPEDFVRRILREQMRAEYVAAGPDLSYGRRGKGDFALLHAISREDGFEAECIEKLRIEGKAVSSTRIRGLLREGDMEGVTRCMGRPYSIMGRIRHGREIGHRIGIPTINQIPGEEKLLPPRGVYYALVNVDGRSYPGMTNVGVKPTVSGSGVTTAETHLLDFDGDLYGRDVETQLLHFRRPEQRFGSLEELQAAIQEDIRVGRQLFDWQPQTAQKNPEYRIKF